MKTSYSNVLCPYLFVRNSKGRSLVYQRSLFSFFQKVSIEWALNFVVYFTKKYNASFQQLVHTSNENLKMNFGIWSSFRKYVGRGASYFVCLTVFAFVDKVQILFVEQTHLSSLRFCKGQYYSVLHLLLARSIITKFFDFIEKIQMNHVKEVSTWA